MKKMTRVGLFFLLSFAFLFSLKNIHADEIYKIGVVEDEMPYSFSENKVRKGIEIDILKKLSEIENFKYTTYPLHFSKILNAVQTEELDGAIARVAITDERKKAFDFSTPYFSSSLMYAIPKENENKIKTLSDTVGKKLGIRTGSNAEQIGYEGQVQYQWELIHASSTAKLFKDLEEKKTDFVLGDSISIAYYENQNKEKIQFLKDFKKEISYGFAVKKGKNKELVEKINHGLEQMEASGELEKIIMKYTNSIQIPGKEIVEKATYTVGYTTDLLSLTQKNENDTVFGFEVELLQLIGEMEHMNFTFTDGSYMSVIHMLMNNKVDLLAIEAMLTNERQKSFDFSVSYMKAGFGFIVPKESTISEIDELKNKTVGVIAGSALQTWAEKNQEKYGYSIKVYLTTTAEFYDFHHNKLDCVIITSDSYYHKAFSEKLRGKLVGNFQDITDIGFIFNRGTNSELREKINRALIKIKADGTYQKLLEKYDVVDLVAKENGNIPNTEVGLEETANKNSPVIVIGIIAGCILLSGMGTYFILKDFRGGEKK